MKKIIVLRVDEIHERLPGGTFVELNPHTILMTENHYIEFKNAIQDCIVSVEFKNVIQASALLNYSVL